ncbi:MAG: hypothetical protein K6G30_12070 [Acetatifactor sp.]|nr:hypothetical protein [Acetatifactor sp.]
MADKLKWLDEDCNICGSRLNSWDVKISKALQYKNNVCEKCIAKEYDIEIDTLRTTMQDLFGLLPCQGI